jgi:hypothetical protein
MVNKSVNRKNAGKYRLQSSEVNFPKKFLG